MAGNITRFDAFIAEEVNKYQGQIVPVKASLLERIFVRKISCKRMHPNPYDEFSQPETGPNYEIISGYERSLKNAMKHRDEDVAWDDPILVEKMLPDGYLILNGHHRWAAAVRLGLPRIRIRVVNLTQETDIRKMLELSEHDKRVTFDLDEVIFVHEDDTTAKERAGVIRGLIYKERLKLGVPALFHFLATKGYDIWVYTSEYYSMEYIRKLFKGYHVPVNGIVTGTSRPSGKSEADRAKVKELIQAHYPETLHIDKTGILRSFADQKEFEQYDLNGNDEDWSRELMNIIGRIRRQ